MADIGDFKEKIRRRTLILGVFQITVGCLVGLVPAGDAADRPADLRVKADRVLGGVAEALDAGAGGLHVEPQLSERLAIGYAGKTAKTVQRDMNALLKLGLVERRRGEIRARRDVMLAFSKPLRRQVENDSKIPGQK